MQRLPSGGCDGSQCAFHPVPRATSSVQEPQPGVWVYRQIDEGQAPDRHAHLQGTPHWAYNDELSRLSGCNQRTPEWRLAMWQHTRELKRKYEPTEYRNHWDDPVAADTAHAAFKQLAVQTRSNCSAASAEKDSDLLNM